MMSGKQKVLAFFIVIGMMVGTYSLFADDDEHEERAHEKKIMSDIKNVSNSKWKKECASCHMLYVPGLLPARSWDKMMGALEKHFGENAALDDTTRKEITLFLVENAADKALARRSQKIANSIQKNEAPLAFSDTYYFQRHHRELANGIFKRKGIGSKANCIACHPGAERGEFEEHDVRIPKK